jgi:peptidyl-prolyl cis-trans isomerase C
MHALALLLALGAAPDAVVARIDGAPVHASLVLAREARARALGSDAPRAKVLEAVVDDLLVARDAKRAGVDAAASIAQGVEAERRRFAAERYATRELDALDVPEQAVRDLYHGGADRFRLKLATYATRADADAGLARLAQGGDFAEEALRSLDSRSKKAKGDLGLVTRMELDPALAAAAAAAPLAKPHGPIALPLGFAVIVVAERALGDEAGFAAQAPQLRTFARESLRREAKKHLLHQLRGAAGVKLDEDFLRATGNRLAATPQEEAHVLATVRGRPVRYGDVLPALRRTVGGEGHLSGLAVKAEFAWAEIDRVLLEEEGLRRGFGDGPEAAAAVADARAWLTAQAVAAKMRADVPAPDAAAIERYYAEHAAELMRPARRACSDIQVETRLDADRARKRIAAGESFEAVARAVSADRQTAAAGGALGEIPLERMDALAKSGEKALARALREAKAGELVGPVFASGAVHLLRCGPVIDAAPAPLASVRDAIAARVRAREQDAALASRLAELRRAARVDVDAAALAALERRG